MSKYLKAEIFRINRKKANIVTFIASYIFIILCYALIGFSSSASFDVSDGSDIIHFMGGSLIISVMPFLVLIVTSLIMDSESKEHGYFRPMEAGIKRKSILNSKILLSYGYGIILLATSFALHSLIYSLAFGWSENNMYIVLYMLKVFVLVFIPVTAMIMMSLFIYFTVKNDFANGFIYLFFVTAIAKVLNIVSIMTGYGIFSIIGKYTPAGTFKIILNDIGMFNLIQYGNIEEIMHINNIVNNMVSFEIFIKEWQYYAVNIAVIIAVYIASRFMINRRDFD